MCLIFLLPGSGPMSVNDIPMAMDPSRATALGGRRSQMAPHSGAETTDFFKKNVGNALWDV